VAVARNHVRHFRSGGIRCVVSLCLLLAGEGMRRPFESATVARVGLLFCLR
jgi:hypothetical protein